MRYREPVVMVKVLDIFRNAVDSCDFGSFPTDPDERAEKWLYIIRSKAKDSGFGRLVDAILENGFDPDSPIGWNEGSIEEGHHRLVAAILLCLDEIPTTPFGGGDGRICAHNGCCADLGEHPIIID
jgi:hypothetical protein